MNNGAGQTNSPPVVPGEILFIVDSKAVQLAANNVYEFKTNYDAYQASIGRKKTYKFKTDQERMQYLIGKQALSCNLSTVTTR
jgi:hypothetical protein